MRRTSRRLSHPDPRVRLEALHAIDSYHPGNHALLDRLARTDPDPWVRTAAAEAPRRVNAGGRSVHRDDALLAELALTDPSDTVRWQVVTAIEDAPALARVLRDARPAALREHAIECSPFYGAVLFAQVARTDRAPRVRMAALGHCLDRRTLNRARRADPHPGVRREAARVLRAYAQGGLT